LEFEKRYGSFHDYEIELQDLEKDMDEQGKLQSLLNTTKGDEASRYNKHIYRRSYEKRNYITHHRIHAIVSEDIFSMASHK